MHRPRLLGNGLSRLARAAQSRSYVTEADIASARNYCLKQLQTSDYDAHLIRRFVPPPVQDAYAALRALNLELVRLPEIVSNPTIGLMRMKFWQESLDKTFAGQPPREPICILLDKSLQDLEKRAGSATKKSIKYWVSRLIKTREKHMDNRPFTSLASLEDYGENTYATLMYATLAMMPLRSMHVDHLASHIGKACGIVAVLRGIPVLAAPAQPVQTPSGFDAPTTHKPSLLLPLDIMAEEGVKEEEVFRQGPNAPGLQEAVFKVATRANDHLITAREMLKRLQAGQDPGHEFEHQGEGEHIYEEDDDATLELRLVGGFPGGFGNQYLSIGYELMRAGILPDFSLSTVRSTTVQSINGATFTDLNCPLEGFHAEMSAAPSQGFRTFEYPPQQPRTCIIHLRLLYAFRGLALRIGYQDGLFGIEDGRSKKVGINSEETERGESKLREKRWAVYLARAVHRYETWWKTLGGIPLQEIDMELVDCGRYDRFPEVDIPMRMEWHELVPLDVLLIWHTHILNPRNYLEDAMRRGLPKLWVGGIPWDLIDLCISSDPNSLFEYQAPEEAKNNWTSQTGLEWDNLDGSPYIELACPVCKEITPVPWTTCELVEQPLASSSNAKTASIASQLKIIGNGYGDGDFKHRCPQCNIMTDADLLCVAKFARDAENLVENGWPMPGTLLSLATGMPESSRRSGGALKSKSALTSPNRLARHVLASRVSVMMKQWRVREKKPTMEDIRTLITTLIEEPSTLSVMANSDSEVIVTPRAAAHLRKVLASYSDSNWSSFGLDLRAAVIRQGLFIDKMYKFDWLHSPALMETMERSVLKYSRFLEIAKKHPDKMVVPTLDLDLAWHTHQLSPQDYYRTTTRELSKFLNHDDKVEDNKLSASFEWMCETYFELYGEIYSTCICWYCEAVRGSQTSSISIMLGKSKRQQALKDLYAQQDLTSCDPGPHISAHNAVKVTVARPSLRHWSATQFLQMHAQRREAGKSRAAKIAKKNGRKSPSKEQYYDHWGYPFLLPGPWVCPVYVDAHMYPSSIPMPPSSASINADGNIGGCIAATTMLYELIGVVRQGSLTEVREIAQTVGSLVVKNGGVIRGLANWGVFALPRPVSIHQMRHTHGHYFVMRYDASTKVHQDVRSTLRLEPRMIRSAHVKLGDGKLETLARFGSPKWQESRS
ncbi:unnamed protein product [Clonostachys solani]|uniref:Small ribosomal subunit protein bS6m n=1 Tax=Clonostachys solani TaxID=160281 RepID=A0A9N9VYT4_9HYPO|nr:unnamed protein product [Clonostachys solani]